MSNLGINGQDMNVQWYKRTHINVYVFNGHYMQGLDDIMGILKKIKKLIW